MENSFLQNGTILKNICLENLDEYVYIKDEKFEYHFANSKIINAMGFIHLKKVLGRTDQHMPWCEFSGEYNEHDSDARQGNIYFQLDMFLDNRQKQALLLTRKFPLYDANGYPWATLGLAKKVNGQLINLFKGLTEYQGNRLKISSYISNIKSKTLTSRESQCLFYILRGRSAKEIASLLNISDKTVNFHVENIKKKWNCRTRSDIFDVAYDYGFFKIIPNEIFYQNIE